MSQSIRADDFMNLIKKDNDILVLDIRSDVERNSLSLRYPSVHLPLHELGLQKISEIREDSTKPLYVLCKAGPRAETACQFMESHGIQNLVVIDGGLMSCAECDADLNHAETPASSAEIQQAIQQSVQKFMMKITAD
jgi:rhodanese-related sulfurtransferase